MSEPLLSPEEQAEQDRLTRQVGRALLAMAPPDWTQIRAEYRSAGRHIEVDVFVSGPDGTPHLMRPPMEVVESLGRMRQLMYRPGRGTWLSATYLLEPPSSFTVDFEPDLEPRWRRLPPPIGFQDELRFFPRAEEHIPDWFRQRAGLPPAIPQPGAPAAAPQPGAPGTPPPNAATPPGGLPQPTPGGFAPGTPPGGLPQPTPGGFPPGTPPGGLPQPGPASLGGPPQAGQPPFGGPPGPSGPPQGPPFVGPPPGTSPQGPPFGEPPALPAAPAGVPRSGPGSFGPPPGVPAQPGGAPFGAPPTADTPPGWTLPEAGPAS